jgi:hypothetical protein
VRPPARVSYMSLIRLCGDLHCRIRPISWKVSGQGTEGVGFGVAISDALRVLGIQSQEVVRAFSDRAGFVGLFADHPPAASAVGGRFCVQSVKWNSLPRRGLP